MRLSLRLFTVFLSTFILFTHPSTPVMATNDPIKIMPLGDSITFGSGSPLLDGYRKELYDLLTTNGYVIDYVGSMNNGSGVDNDHEGHKGYTSAQLLAGLPVWLSQSHPDIILIHTGTNDIRRNISRATTIGNLDDIIETIHTASANTLIVVAEIIPLSGYATYVNQLNQAIVNLASSKSSAGRRIISVNLNASFGSSGLFISDKLHPNQAGYSRMVPVWYQGIKTAYQPKQSADADADGSVDGIDFSIWQRNYNHTVTGGRTKGDFDNSGEVDGIDFSIWQRSYDR